MHSNRGFERVPRAPTHGPLLLSAFTLRGYSATIQRYHLPQLRFGVVPLPPPRRKRCSVCCCAPMREEGLLAPRRPLRLVDTAPVCKTRPAALAWLNEGRPPAPSVHRRAASPSRPTLDFRAIGVLHISQACTPAAFTNVHARHGQGILSGSSTDVEVERGCFGQGWPEAALDVAQGSASSDPTNRARCA
eukprot:scaffold64708_cov27-Tisochrysis_lutea.AAC.2